MSKPYRYRYRPAYGSDEMLLEFIFESTDTEFIQDLFKALETIHPKVDALEDIWMNDETLVYINSDEGGFTFSKDIWDFAFIMAEKNQRCISIISDILANNPLFKKEEVDFKDYK